MKRLIQGMSWSGCGTVAMALEITHLGTGSRGNSTLLSTEDTKVLIDCGFSGRQMEKRLATIGVKPEEINAIVLSHHHTDHGQGAAIFQKRWGADIHANFTTCAGLGLDPVNQCQIFDALERMEFGDDISLLPVPIPHDGAENVGFIFSDRRGARGAQHEPEAAEAAAREHAVGARTGPARLHRLQRLLRLRRRHRP